MEIFFYLKNKTEYVIHPYVCLAEGFAEMGIKSYSGHDHCKLNVEEGGDYLIKYDEKHPMGNADIVFIHNSLYTSSSSLSARTGDDILTAINRRPRKYITVFIDDYDGLRTPGFRKSVRLCDIVLKSHYNLKYKYPENFRPWQFGLCKRIINAVSPIPYQKRIPQIVVNFRAKHQLRDYINRLIKPIIQKYLIWNDECEMFTSDGLSDMDLLYWKQTGARHYPAYYEKLSTSKLCACYGGVFAVPTGNHNKYTAKIARLINTVIPLYEWDRVRQWDSWRLWEAWAAGCCVLHIDLEKYGCLLPVMPKNGVHYIGIDIKNLSRLEDLFSIEANRLIISTLPPTHAVGNLLSGETENLEKQSLLGEIAANGRDFAINHYAPKKVAERIAGYLY
jgi:hypothetical protein